ncbi:MAG: carbonic anhydrase family protein [Legionella sp.]|nr:carbonic anhydrase family protein [Legionella sp.]
MKYRKGCKSGLILGLMGLATIAMADNASSHSTVMSADQQEAKTPAQVLQRLKDGNQRFTEGKLKNRDLVAQAYATAKNQHPVAVILNCMDARTPPELVFDQGIGDVFTLRVAGNVQNDDILGSMEFGTKVVGAKLIAVIGHTNCGAIRGACNQVKLGHLTGVLQKIEPALNQVDKEKSAPDCSSEAVINEIAKDNVLVVMKQIQERSPVLAKLIQEGEVGIVGGIQDLSTGKVTFFDTESIMPKTQG